MMTRAVSDLQFVKTRDPLPTVEVLAESLEEQGLSIDGVVVPVLRRLAAENQDLRATISVLGRSSVSFHRETFSEFLLIAGPQRVLQAVRSAFDSRQGIEVRSGDYVLAKDATPAFHLEDGLLWEPEDSLTWFCRSEPPVRRPVVVEGSQSGVAQLPGSEQDDEGTPDGASADAWVRQAVDPSDVQNYPAPGRQFIRAARYRAARNDATVSRIRQTVEEVFGLPAGSVALCGPDGRHMRGDAFIKTLRRRWEEQ